MDLLGVAEISMQRTWKVSVGKMKLEGMPPETLRLTLAIQVSLFHITHNFYHCDLMTLHKNFCTRH